MPYKTGYWGKQAQERSKKRRSYFRQYAKLHAPPKKVFRLGKFGELLANRKLNGSRLTNKPGYDLIWNGQKIEVKTSQIPAINKKGRNSHSFDIRIQKRNCNTDFFFALILDEHTKELLHAYLIPDKAITAKVTLRISPGRSKYENYRLWLKPSKNHARIIS